RLDEQIAEIRGEARAAAGLAADAPDLLRDATTASWHGRPALHKPARTLIYKKRSDGSVIGIAVDATMLEQAAGHDRSDDVAIHARPLVLPAGNSLPREFRELAVAQFGDVLPH